MQFATRLLILASLLFMASGCGSMCVSTQDANFHAYGGVRNRSDLVNGRVASLFDAASALPGVPVVEEPLPPDESQRSTDDDDSDDEESMDMTESDFRNNLLDELEKLDALPSDLDEETEDDTDDSADPEDIDVI